MEGISLKHIIFGVLILLFYLAKKSITKKLHEAQQAGKQNVNDTQPDMDKYEEDFQPREVVYYEADDDAFPDEDAFPDNESQPETEEYISKTFSGNTDEYNTYKDDTYDYDKFRNDDDHDDYQEFKEYDGFKEDGGFKKDEPSEKKNIPKKVIDDIKTGSIGADSHKEREKNKFKPDKRTLRKAIVWSEILAPPVSERDDFKF